VGHCFYFSAITCPILSFKKPFSYSEIDEMTYPKFYRVEPGDKGPHCEGYGRALAKANKWWFGWTMLVNKRTWGWWHKRAVNKIKKKLGLREDGIYVLRVHDWLLTNGYFDDRAIALVNSYVSPPPVPNLGPVWVGGKSILLQDLTHETAGISLYPAFDDAFMQGREVIAPEDIVVDKKYSSSVPGKAFYATGASKIQYWFGHLDRNHPIGAKFKKGQVIGKVAPNNIGGGPHVHVGINVELLFGPGKELEHHKDYTHGAPLVGVQLAKGL
jgi:hypothetical protein